MTTSEYHPPHPASSAGGTGREYEFVADVGSGWRRAAVSDKDFDAIDHVVLNGGTLTRLAVSCEEDPGALEVRVSLNGVVAFSRTFTNQVEVWDGASLVVAQGDALRVETRSVSDPKAKDTLVVLGMIDADDETTVDLEAEAPTHYALPVEVLDAVMQNLASQPYGQVVDLIAAVQREARPA